MIAINEGKVKIGEWLNYDGNPVQEILRLCRIHFRLVIQIIMQEHSIVSFREIRINENDTVTMLGYKIDYMRLNIVKNSVPNSRIKRRNLGGKRSGSIEYPPQ